MPCGKALLHAFVWILKCLGYILFYDEHNVVTASILCKKWCLWRGTQRKYLIDLINVTIERKKDLTRYLNLKICELEGPKRKRSHWFNVWQDVELRSSAFSKSIHQRKWNGKYRWNLRDYSSSKTHCLLNSKTVGRMFNNLMFILGWKKSNEKTHDSWMNSYFSASERSISMRFSILSSPIF